MKMQALRIKILWFKEVCKCIRSEDRMIGYYMFFTLVIGVAAGFSFAYILFLSAGFAREVPLQTLSFRRPARILNTDEHSNYTRTYQDGDRTVAEKLAKKVRVFCWVMTHPGNHETKAKHVKATWGKRCNKLLFMSTEEDKNLPALNLQVSEGWLLLWGKTKAAFRYLYEHHRDDADWFLKADDDTYIIVDNLRHMLADYDSRDAIYFGCGFKNFTPQGYMSGGAGYVLSREALNRFVTIALNEPKLCRELDIGMEDVEMGKCLYNVGVSAMDSRDKQERHRFLPFRPDLHVFPKMNESFWFWQYIVYPMNSNLTCCSDYAISFHNLSPGMMYAIEYFLYHLRSYGFRHDKAPLPEILRSSEDPDSSEIAR